LYQPGGDHDSPNCSARQQPRLEEGFHIDPDGLKDEDHESREDTAAEGDQHIVDEEFARETDEVHATTNLAPAAARVSDTYHQPERDRQVQRREGLSVATWSERIDIGDYSRCNERRGQPADCAGVESPFPDEISGQEGQHEEAQIAE